MKKQISAVEWLVLHLNKEEWFTHKQKQTIEQAKQMEKEQIIDAILQSVGMKDDEKWVNLFKEQAEQYYNETFTP